MRTFILALTLATPMFAAADKGAGAGAGATPATETPAVPADESGSVSTRLDVLVDADKLTKLREAFGSGRIILSNLDDAIAKFSAISEATDSFFGLASGIKGYDDETGEVDSSIYEGQDVVIQLVGSRVKPATKDEKGIDGVKAVVVFPIPTLDGFLADDKGKAWLDKIRVKEATHVAFRNVRDVDTTREFINGVKAMPVGVEGYLAEYVRSAGQETSTFDALWNGLRLSLKKSMPDFAKLLPQKPELIKAIRSAAYANSQPELAPLEEIGAFVALATMIIEAAGMNVTKDNEPAPLPTDAIESWLAERDTLVLEAAKAPEKDFSLLKGMGSLFGAKTE